MTRRRLPSIRAFSRRLREPDGFGLIELMIALSVLAIATVALTGVFVASHLTLRRASQSDAAAALSDQLLERFRAETWDNIALNDSQVGSADSNATDTTYKNDTPVGQYVQGATPAAATDSAGVASDITQANVPLAADGTATAASACTNSPEPVTCYPVRTALGPDGKSYRIDTYVTWSCPNPGAQTLGGAMNAPTCTDTSSGDALPYAPVKVVTIVVRDASTLASVYRTSTTFDRLGGGSVPKPTVTPTGTGSTGGTTTAPPVTGAPNPPLSVSFVNGGGSGSPCPCITPTNEAAGLSFDVQLPSTSLASDTVTLTLTDATSPNDTVTYTAAATTGSGIVHFYNVMDTNTAVPGNKLADGPITISATATNGSGVSDPAIATTTKDTTPPGPPTITTPASGANGVSTSGPFTGTAGSDFTDGDMSTVTVELCQSSTWCSSPTKVSTPVDSSGNWSVSFSGGAKLTPNKAYMMVVVQQDAAGNTGTSPTISFKT
jgi:uncharacterized protein (TIGR02598 family)